MRSDNHDCTVCASRLLAARRSVAWHAAAAEAPIAAASQATALAAGGTVPRRTHARRRRHTRPAGDLLDRRGQRRRLEDDGLGRTWNPLFDSAPTQSIGAIAVAPSDPAIIYVASGEGLQRPDLSVGNGIYRSGGCGATWAIWRSTMLSRSRTSRSIREDPNRVYAAVLGHPFGPSAQRGIFRSVDGGKNWTRIACTSTITRAARASRSIRKIRTCCMRQCGTCAPGPWEDKNVFNGAAGGLYKSSDGGEHWRRLSQRTSGESIADRSGGCAEPAGPAVRDGRHDRRRRLQLRCRSRRVSLRRWRRKLGSAPPPIRGRRCASAAAIYRIIKVDPRNAGRALQRKPRHHEVDGRRRTLVVAAGLAGGR